MWTKTLGGCLLVGLLSGCGTNGPGTGQSVDLGCLWARPIYTSVLDEFTDGTAQQILAHNLAGAERCGWKAANSVQ